MKGLVVTLGTATCLLAGGCLPDVWSWSDALDDPLATMYSNEGFDLDPSCELTGPLDVEIGFGEFAFTPLVNGHQFQVVYGPQGGSHVYGALRVNNPALDFPRLEVIFELLDDDDCVPRSEEVGLHYRPGSHADWAYTEDELTRDCWPREVGYRHGILRGPLHTSADGAVEETGIFIFHAAYGGDGAERVRLSVRDPCGRIGQVERAVTD